MPDVTCPNCGNNLPEETGQHALTPSAGLVACPHCGATVTLPKPGSADGPRVVDASGAQESFAGRETVEGVMDELREKEDR